MSFVKQHHIFRFIEITIQWNSSIKATPYAEHLWPLLRVGHSWGVPTIEACIVVIWPLIQWSTIEGFHSTSIDIVQQKHFIVKLVFKISAFLYKIIVVKYVWFEWQMTILKVKFPKLNHFYSILIRPYRISFLYLYCIRHDNHSFFIHSLFEILFF